MLIREITSASELDPAMVSEWLSQLTGKALQTSFEELDRIAESQNSHLFILEDEGDVPCGMVTVSFCYVLSYGISAWVDDVFVTPESRGKHFGSALIDYAIEYARKEGASIINLTSSPFRTSAISMYTGKGFEKRDSNIYRKKL